MSPEMPSPEMYTNEAPPEHFICPLTMEVMSFPLIHIASGHSFERQAINCWMFVERKQTCPLTRQPISPSDFVENKKLKFEIQQWKKEYNVAEDDREEEEDDEEDDDVLIQKAKESLEKIRVLSKNKLDCKYEELMDLGNKILQERNQKLRQQRQRNCKQQSHHFRFPSVVEYLEQYQ